MRSSGRQESVGDRGSCGCWGAVFATPRVCSVNRTRRCTRLSYQSGPVSRVPPPRGGCSGASQVAPRLRRPDGDPRQGFLRRHCCPHVLTSVDAHCSLRGPPPSLFHQRVVQIRLLTGVSFKMKRTLPFKVIDSPLPRIVFPLPLGSQCRAERMDGRAARRAVQVRARAAGSLPGKLDGRRVQRPVPGRSSVRAGHRPSLDSETLCFAPCPQHGCGGVCRHASGEAGPHDVSQKP